MSPPNKSQPLASTLQRGITSVDG